MPKKVTGLFKRGDIWYINKQIRGVTIYESTGTANREEAEEYLNHRLNEHRQASIYGVRPKRTFEQAAIHYLQEYSYKTSIECDATSLAQVMPYIGHLHLDEIHDGTVKPYIDYRRKNGFKSATVKRDLAIVRRILRLAAQSWRDEYGLSWLEVPPLLQIPDWKDARKPRPLSYTEQEVLFDALPEHIREMALFKVNTGCREQEVCGLSWDWEFPIPELNTSVFVIPAHEGVKNGEDRLVVLNQIALAVVNRQRGKHKENVFTYRGRRIHRINNSGWKDGRVAAGLPDIRVHDLKHTFGFRLRAAGVSHEDRQILLGHTNGSITTHYSSAEIGNLVIAVNKIVDISNVNIPSIKSLSRANVVQSISQTKRKAARI